MKTILLTAITLSLLATSAFAEVKTIEEVAVLPFTTINNNHQRVHVFEYIQQAFPHGRCTIVVAEDIGNGSKADVSCINGNS